MDVFWKGDLHSPRKSAIYELPRGEGCLMVRDRDIHESERLNGDEIKCTCQQEALDAEGKPVYFITRMRAWPVRSIQGRTSGTAKP